MVNKEKSRTLSTAGTYEEMDIKRVLAYTYREQVLGILRDLHSAFSQQNLRQVDENGSFSKAMERKLHESATV